MSDHNVPVDQRVRRRSSEAAIQPGLFNLHFSLRVNPGPGPSRLVDFGGADVASSAPDPSEDIANCVVPANDKSTHATRQGMEAISI